MSNYKTVRPIHYDWVDIPIGTPVTRLEDWRPHNVHQHIALFKLPQDQVCPLFFDEVEEEQTIEYETEECPTCGGSGFAGYGSGYDAVCDNCGGQREIVIGVKFKEEPTT